MGKAKSKSKKQKISRSTIGLTKKKAVKMFNFLSAVKSVSPKAWVALSPYLTKEAYNMLSDTTLNSIYSNSVSPAMKNKIRNTLGSKKDLIRELSQRSKSLRARRHILPQVGGSIGLVIASVLPLILNFLKSKKVI